MVGGATFGIGALHTEPVPSQSLRHCSFRKLGSQPKLAEVPEASEEPVLHIAFALFPASSKII